MAFFWELVGYIIYKFMKTKFEEIIYESPQVEILEVEVEKGFAVSVTSENGNEGIIEEYM